jgi:bifunctional enzyme CysN/CysC
VRGLCRCFTEIWVSTPLAECERRDAKGLYARARAGEVAHFTGLGDAYEPPSSPELTIDTTGLSVDDAVATVVRYLASGATLPASSAAGPPRQEPAAR